MWRDSDLGLKVSCAPKWFDLEFPTIKTTKLVVETRLGTRATRMYPWRLISSYRAPLRLNPDSPTSVYFAQAATPERALS